MELAALAPGVTDAGENEQLRVLGNPEHVSATAVLKEPDCGVTVTFMVPDAPGLIVIADGFAAILIVPF